MSLRACCQYPPMLDGCEETDHQLDLDAQQGQSPPELYLKIEGVLQLRQQKVQVRSAPLTRPSSCPGPPVRGYPLPPV
jgi:hypothetical protein